MTNKKYKEKRPEQTIEAIKSFFNGLNLKIRESVNENEIGTWSSKIILYFKDRPILMTNGKSTDMNYALASGYAELYERFSSFFKYNSSNIFLNYLNIGEDFNYDKWLEKTSYSSYYKIGDNINKERVSSFLNGKLCFEKYTNLINKEEKFFDNRELIYFEGSNGCASGNTITEALNQAISEIYERECLNNILNNKFTNLHEVPIEKIKNSELRTLLSRMSNTQKKFKIIDLSYNYKLPVVMIIFTDLVTSKMCINLGCFPIFNIALERCITELYQNLRFWEDAGFGDFQKPYLAYKDPVKKTISESYRNTRDVFCINEEMIDNIIPSEINKNIYLDDEVSNEDIYEYWTNKINELSDSIYWKNCSLSESIYSVRVVKTTGNKFINSNDVFIAESNNNELVIAGAEKGLLLQTSLTGNNYNFEEFWNSFLFLNKLSPNIQLEIQSNYLRNNIIGLFNVCSLSIKQINELLIKVSTGDYKRNNINTLFYDKDLLKYNLINIYKKTGLYKNEEIIEILNIFNEEICNEDIEKSEDKKYLLENIFYKPIRSIIKSDDFNKITQLFLKEVKNER